MVLKMDIYEYFIKSNSGNLPYKAINYRVRISENCSESEIMEILKRKAFEFVQRNPTFIGKFFLANRNVSAGRFGNRYRGFIKIGKFVF